MKNLDLFKKENIIDYIPPIEGGISLTCYENDNFSGNIYENEEKKEIVAIIIKNKNKNSGVKNFYCDSCGCSYESNEDLNGVQCHCGGYILPS